MVLAVAVLFLIFAYSGTGIVGISGYKVSAKFGRINGVTVGSDVRMSGVKIGTVSGIEIDPQDYGAITRLTIGEDLQLPDGFSDRITSDGLLGNQYVLIEPGGSQTMSAPGGQIEYTQWSIGLISLLSRTIFGGGDNGAQ